MDLSTRVHPPFLPPADLTQRVRNRVAQPAAAVANLDDLAAEVAAGQHGLVTRSQLEAVGVGARTIHRRLAAGRWSQPAPRVIDLHTHVGRWTRGLSTALLVGGPGRAWASHRTAAYLHGFLDVRRPDILDVLLLRGLRRQRTGVSFRTTRSLPAEDRVRVDGFPVTSVARTFADLTSMHTDDVLEPILWELLRADPRRGAHIARCAARHPTPGVRRNVARLLQDVHPQVGRADSPLEVFGLLGLRNQGLPWPVLQFTVRDVRGRYVRRVDAAWPAARLAIEFDGAAYHGSPRQRAADQRLRDALRDLGWRVVVIRAADLHGKRIQQIAAEIHAHLAEHGIR